MKTLKTALKETARMMLRVLLGVGIGWAFIILFIPDLRAFVFAQPWPVIMGTVRIVVVFFVLIMAAQLALVWVRAEKKEEDKV